MATQARYLLARVERVRNAGNWMRGVGMSETQAGIEINFGSRFELRPRDCLQTEEAHSAARVEFRRVALQAERIHIRANLRLEGRRMRLVADQALAVPVGTMEYRVQLGLVALRA